MKATDFTIGQSVILTRANWPRARGHIGTVEKIIKSRDVLRIRLDSGMSAGETYDANAKNVDPLTTSETLDELIARRQAEPEQTARERKRIHRIRQARLLDARGVKVWRGRKLPLPRSASAQ